MKYQEVLAKIAAAADVLDRAAEGGHRELGPAEYRILADALRAASQPFEPDEPEPNQPDEDPNK